VRILEGKGEQERGLW